VAAGCWLQFSATPPHSCERAAAAASTCRDFFLQPFNYARVQSPLVQRTGELLRKMWNPRRFRGAVSPHEFMQVGHAL